MPCVVVNVVVVVVVVVFVFVVWLLLFLLLLLLLLLFVLVVVFVLERILYLNLNPMFESVNGIWEDQSALICFVITKYKVLDFFNGNRKTASRAVR